MKKIILTFLALAFGTAIAFAQDPISERKAAMKSVGAAAKEVGAMMKGEKPYDAAAALAALQKMNEVSKVIVPLFPEGSETGGKTTAKSTIWTDRAGFEAAMAKFEADTAAAIAAAPADLDAFKAAFDPVGKNCGVCHKAYRIAKE